MLSQRDTDRFWSLVDRSGGEDSCWEWQRGRTSAGYGEFCADGTTLYAHRAAYELGHGPIADGDYVCHVCDNPPCCNPRHLFSGPPHVNVDDKVRKGRQLRGEETSQALLAASEVVTARIEHAERGTMHKVLAERFGVHKATISDAIRGETWAHVGGPLTRRRVVTRELATEWRKLFVTGDYTKAQIARDFGFSKTTVGDLLNGKTAI